MNPTPWNEIAIAIATSYGMALVYHDDNPSLKASVTARGRDVGMFPDCHVSDGVIEVSKRKCIYADLHEIAHLITCQEDPVKVVDWGEDGRDEYDVEHDAIVAEVLLGMYIGLGQKDLEHLATDRNVGLLFDIEVEAQDSSYFGSSECTTGDPIQIPLDQAIPFLIPEHQAINRKVRDAIRRAGYENLLRKG
ncbi:MAG: hypothetical protein LAT68_16085 [Cyclobacteriaceae bacterium]|nr:hypothetical protein [Cyclobacteriaceae bacterium]